MANVKVRVHTRGAQSVLRSPGVVADINRRGEAVLSAACGMVPGDGDAPFELSVSDRTRARAAVYVASERGAQADRDENVLLRSILKGG